MDPRELQKMGGGIFLAVTAFFFVYFRKHTPWRKVVCANINTYLHSIIFTTPSQQSLVGKMAMKNGKC